MTRSKSLPLLLLLGSLVLLLSGCHKRGGDGGINKQISWQMVHVAKEYTDTLTSRNWQDTTLSTPTYTVSLDLLEPAAEGDAGVIADSLRSYLIACHALEGPDYEAHMSVQSYLDSVVALGLGGYISDLTRAKTLMRDDAESPTALLSFFVEEMFKSDSLTYNQSDLVSVKISQYDFSGGANGTTSIRSANYDLKHNTPVTVHQLFADGSEDKIDELLLAALMKSFGVDSPDALADKGVYFYEEAKMGEYFYLTSEGVTFYFNPYDIAAHFVGPIELTLPYADIAGCLKDEYKQRLMTE
ncbi:DUF3298 and DUF4163 domain-containing protein [uncultured Porphyromonas sp.]|uniref:DUF3298 and DUF4163 domain-containing protein n=1 Tax=uncultured Porphyromonas sp. TaxID=159274 RepID=UPI0026292682|nr:DUF3298 and DUF4163 domain-containing protein [uncultured Porphyromonas sp.]